MACSSAVISRWCYVLEKGLNDRPHLFLIGFMGLDGLFQIGDLDVTISEEVAQSLSFVYALVVRRGSSSHAPHWELYIFCILAWFALEFSRLRCRL